jgi:ABC-2 type transport system permease protein
MFRDKRSLLFLVAMPIVFTIFMGFAYRGGNKEADVDTRIPLAVVDPEPETLLNKMLLGRLDSSSEVRIERMTEAEAMESLRREDVAGVLVVPAGFSGQVAAGKDAQLTLIANPSSAEGQSLYQALRVPISQLMSAVQAARLSAEAQGSEAEFAPAFDLAWEKWDVSARLPLVDVEAATAPSPESEDWTGGNPYNQASPGILVQFAIFGLVTSGQILVQERKSGTLQRLITTSMRPWEIVAGHLLAMFSVVFLQTLMLVLFGQWVLKVDYLRVPLGTLLISVTLGLWVASMGLLIGVLAREDQQVILYAMIAMFLFSALGGTWFPLEASSGVFASLGRLTPSSWAMTGLQNMLIRGLGLESIWQPAAIIFVYALGFFGLAVWRFRKMAM